MAARSSGVMSPAAVAGTIPWFDDSKAEKQVMAGQPTTP